MHRLRVGLTGLGVVLVLVFAAAASDRPRGPMEPAGTTGETLSALGVAPSVDPEGDAAVVVAPTPAEAAALSSRASPEG